MHWDSQGESQGRHHWAASCCALLSVLSLQRPAWLGLPPVHPHQPTPGQPFLPALCRPTLTLCQAASFSIYLPHTMGTARKQETQSLAWKQTLSPT